MEKEQLLEETGRVDTAREPKKKKKLSLGGKKGKKRLIAAVVAVALVAAAAMKLLSGGAQQMPAASYRAETVQRRDVGSSVTGTATLEPADAYNVTTLLSATILSAPFEEGDLVDKDTLLYTLDSTDARDSVSRANISTQQAQLSFEQAQEALKPTAPISGTISEVYAHDGDSVTAGAELARIVTSTDITADFLFIYVSPSDFYAGQSATVFLDGVDGSVQGTVVSVSSSGCCWGRPTASWFSSVSPPASVVWQPPHTKDKISSSAKKDRLIGFTVPVQSVRRERLCGSPDAGGTTTVFPLRSRCIPH